LSARTPRAELLDWASVVYGAAAFWVRGEEQEGSDSGPLRAPQSTPRAAAGAAAQRRIPLSHLSKASLSGVLAHGAWRQLSRHRTSTDFVVPASSPGRRPAGMSGALSWSVARGAPRAAFLLPCAARSEAC